MLVFIIADAATQGGVEAQEVRLRAGDMIDLEVPQRQELNRRLTITDDGIVILPVIGEIMVEGLLLEEAQRLILRRMREIYPSVQDLALSLVGVESRRQIYVHGEVLNPGKYEFRKNPNVWEAVREAGGGSPTASLDVVRVIRAEEEGRRTFIVNLEQVIENGDFSSLPELRPGDTVIVPPRVVQFQGSGSVRVIGSVLTPGPYKLSGTKTLTDALLAAGGPDDDANLKKVQII
ncbi:MAG TPA: SLBB domain-containing protein, partial [Candidatus Krumholzibacterium sp.]|nr:SLBB domain-containing protein [Candidatus Krumholzibacterium sp.]